MAGKHPLLAVPSQGEVSCETSLMVMITAELLCSHANTWHRAWWAGVLRTSILGTVGSESICKSCKTSLSYGTPQCVGGCVWVAPGSPCIGLASQIEGKRAG